MLLKVPETLKFIVRCTSVSGAPQKLPHRMQAWQIHSYGDLSEIQLSQARLPVIQSPEDVLIKVKAASLNPIDRMIIAGYGKELLGYMRSYEFEFPLTLGRDFAGTVIDKGHGVSDELKVGDEVYGAVAPYKQGTLAEIILCNSRSVCHRPNNVPSLEATSITYAAMTAWSALYLTGGLNVNSARQSKILILGASGGVGTVAVQILKSQGAIVVGTCSNDALGMVKSLGADYAFDYRDKDYCRDVASVGMYDIILDCAKFGYQNVPESWKYKKFITLNSPLLINSDKYGLFSGLAISARDIVSANATRLFQGKSVRWAFFSSDKEGLKFITKLIREGKITPVIQRVFKFSEVPKAFAALTEGHLRGKIVIDFS